MNSTVNNLRRIFKKYFLILLLLLLLLNIFIDYGSLVFGSPIEIKVPEAPEAPGPRPSAGFFIGARRARNSFSPVDDRLSPAYYI